MSQRLIIEDDEGTTTIVPLGKDAVTIGRQQGNTIQLTEKNVSRRHARLYPEQAAWVIEDLGSYNGIKVNGVPIDGRVTLKEGDVVQIGDYHLALTEDVDKRSLNYQGVGAANDGAAPIIEPMLASSSTDLPRLSADELAALQSGPHAISQPTLLDSGPVPATPVPHGYDDRRKSGAGVLVGFGVVVAIALVGGIAWMAVGGDDDEATGTQIAKADEKGSVAAKADNKAPPVADAKEPQPVPPPTGANDDAAAVPIEAGEGGEPPSEVEPPPSDDGEAEVVVPEDPPELVEDPPDPGTKKSHNKAKPKSTAIKKDPGPPPAPPAPAVDVATMLADARKAALREGPAKGYELANKALKAGGGREAAKLVATLACRMGDAGKAKKALARLKGTDRDAVAAICREKGISV